MAEKKKSKQSSEKEILISDGISANVVGDEIIIKNENGELKKKISNVVDVEIEGDKIILKIQKLNKQNKKMFGTMNAHIVNMIRGLNEKFKYKLEVASVHFPITIEYNKDKDELVIKNFLGEKKDRIVKLVPGVDVKIDKEFIEIESINKELAGQCAANIEKGAHVRNRDRRIFQDGIYIIKKPGRKL